MAKMPIPTNEQYSDLEDDTSEIEEIQLDLWLSVASKESVESILNNIERLEEVVKRMTTKLEDIINV